jgi:hypothetical protein
MQNLLSPISSLIDFCTFLAYMLRISFWTSGDVYFAFLGALSSTTSSTSLLYKAKILTISRKLPLFKEPGDSSWPLKEHP